MSPKKNTAPPLGEVRHSQLLTTYGPGAMVDLPEKSVVIGGLDLWWYDRNDERSTITEPRLLEKLRGISDLSLSSGVQLRRPPVLEVGPAGVKPGGIRAPEFPNWFVAQPKEPISHTDERGRVYRTRPLVHKTSLEGRKYRFSHKDQRVNLDVVPVRFVQCCPHGHLSDVDWRRFVHSGPSRCREKLWLDESGSGNDFNEIYVRCDCGARQPLAKTKNEDGSSTLGRCQGHRPWLGSYGQEAECVNDNGKPNYNRLLIRSASNAYFPEIISAISIPEAVDPIRPLISKNLSSFEKATSVEMLEMLMGFLPDRLSKPIQAFAKENSLQLVFDTLESIRGNKPNPNQGNGGAIKEEEIRALYQGANQLGQADPDSPFHAEILQLGGKPKWFRERFDRVLKVHRLREVMSLIGFTRLEPVVKGVDGDPLDVGSKRAALNPGELSWLPAVENYGEGIFLGVNEELLKLWAGQPEVKAHCDKHRSAFQLWNKDNGIDAEAFPWPGAEYVMLHSLSHLLITQASLECGYSASAIKERIYAFPGKGYGILLYTGGSGSEGTLGGLVALADRIDELLKAALESGRLCTNDPFCSMHEPESEFEKRYSHGAACHGCLLIAETSCEQRNQFLDRAFVVGTLHTSNAAFFPEELRDDP